jgi:flavin reductase (DIM6/NTAB) family NADH-FMN oxidoreductase RutF
MPDPQTQPLAKALGRIPSGVFVLTATLADQSTATLVSWVQQTSFSPPALAFALAKDRPVRKFIENGARFALSILGKSDHALMKKYARGIPEDQDPFTDVATARTAAGAIYLADSAAWLECQLLQTVDFNADHDLFIAQIIDGALLKDDPPFTHVRGNGFHY